MIVFIQTESLIEKFFKKVAGWLRKLNTNQLDSAHMVSNPVFVMILIGCIEKLLALWNFDPAIWV